MTTAQMKRKKLCGVNPLCKIQCSQSAISSSGFVTLALSVKAKHVDFPVVRMVVPKGNRRWRNPWKIGKMLVCLIISALGSNKVLL